MRIFLGGTRPKIPSGAGRGWGTFVVSTRLSPGASGGTGKIAQPTGPGAISLYSPGASEPLRRLNNYLRRDGNTLGNAITELAILVAAREGDSQYIWSAH